MVACLALFAFCLVPRFRSDGIVAIYQIGVPALGALFALMIYDTVHHYVEFSKYARQLSDDSIQINAFFQVVSTLYAIVIAFTLWKAMTDHDNLKSTLRDEASKIKAIVSFMEYFDNVDNDFTRESVAEIRTRLAEYVRIVTDPTEGDVNSTNSEHLRKCVELVERLYTPEENDRIALDGVIKGIADLIMIRSRRISLIESCLPQYLIFILGLISLATLSFFIFDSRELNAAHFVIPTLTFMYVFLTMMIVDLNQPFGGYWNVKSAAFREVLYLIEKDAQAQESAIVGGLPSREMAIGDR